MLFYVPRPQCPPVLHRSQRAELPALGSLWPVMVMLSRISPVSDQGFAGMASLNSTLECRTALLRTGKALQSCKVRPGRQEGYTAMSSGAGMRS